MLHLYDTARGEVVPFETREPGKVSIYVCGPTVYAPPHIGHGRQTLVYDVLRRYLEWRGFEVRHASNVTDIDDQIINRAREEGTDETTVAATYEKVWWDAMDRLGVERPTDTPHATEYVEEMIEAISAFLADGVAYETSDGVYLDTSKVDGYGLLALQNLDDLRAGARVEANEEKRSPLDFVLWKNAKPGEPTWDAPFGEGRPGWHTECVVMSLDLLGPGFDLHAGGQDLRFPHHENERAQAVAMKTGFANHWMHHAFVESGGEKMSKSLGNVTNLVDLISEFDPRAARVLILRSHYRSPMDVTGDAMRDAEAAVSRLDSFGRRARTLLADQPAEPDADVIDRFVAAMNDDLDTPAASGVLFETVRRVNTMIDNGDSASAAEPAAAVLEILDAVGLTLAEAPDDVDDDAVDLARRRDEARAAKDWSSADALRDELQDAGYVVEDTAGGTQIRRR